MSLYCKMSFGCVAIIAAITAATIFVVVILKIGIGWEPRHAADIGNSSPPVNGTLITELNWSGSTDYKDMDEWSSESPTVAPEAEDYATEFGLLVTGLESLGSLLIQSSRFGLDSVRSGLVKLMHMAHKRFMWTAENMREIQQLGGRIARDLDKTIEFADQNSSLSDLIENVQNATSEGADKLRMNELPFLCQLTEEFVNAALDVASGNDPNRFVEDNREHFVRLQSSLCLFPNDWPCVDTLLDNVTEGVRNVAELIPHNLAAPLMYDLIESVKLEIELVTKYIAKCLNQMIVASAIVANIDELTVNGDVDAAMNQLKNETAKALKFA